MKRYKESSEVIICTRNRPFDFANLFTSIKNQSTNLVSKLTIIDSSSDGKTEIVVKDLSIGVSFEVEYIRVNQEMSLTMKRNIGLEKVDHDTEFIHFFDDDVILDENYLESIIDAFQDQTIAGITGKDIARTPQKNSAIKFKLGMGSHAEGVILRNGLNTLVTSATEPIFVEWLSGCAMSYRAKIIASLRFDTRRIFDGEDTDFSFRVSYLGKLLWCPNAKYTHQTSKKDIANNNHRVHAYLTHMALATLEFNGKVSFLNTWIGIFLFGSLIVGFGIRRRNLTGVLQGLRYVGGSVIFPGIVVFWKIQKFSKGMQTS